MRVALVGPYPVDPDRIPGGVTAATYGLAQGLRQHPDIDLHVISPSTSLRDDKRVVGDGITVYHLAAPKKRIMPNLLSNIRRVRSVIDEIKPDIVHGETAFGTIAGVRAGYPTVNTIHGILHLEVQYQDSLRQKLATFFEAAQAKTAVASVRHCIAVTDYAARAYAPFTKAQMHLIYNPVEDTFFNLASREAPNKLLHTGVVCARKNVLGLVRAFDLVHRENPLSSLFVCGRMSQAGYKARIVDYIKRHQLGDAVHLLGYVDQEEIERHFQEMAVLCLFSFEETMGIAIAQAMCMGKPVVVSNAGGMPEIVEDGRTGFIVDVGDERALADRVGTLLADDNLRREMGRRAREIAEERFRKETVAAKTIEVYQAALSSS